LLSASGPHREERSLGVSESFLITDIGWVRRVPKVIIASENPQSFNTTPLPVEVKLLPERFA
jgi:hypothetical protein